MKRIIISDATLKTIEELSLSLTFREKLSVAEKLDACGVDAIELPSLIGSKENEIIYRTIASSVKNSTVKIPVGSTEESVNSAYDCVKSADKVCLQVVMPVSTALMEYNYHLKATAMQEKICALVKVARSLCDRVEFVALDAFRAEEGFVETLAKSVYESGACCMTICDDAGEATFNDYKVMVEKIKGACDIKLFVQPSNALSMAAASAVVAINAGVDGIKTSAVGEYLSAEVLADIFRAKKYQMDAECGLDVTKVSTITSAIKGVTDLENEEVVTSSDFSGVIENTATMTDVSRIVRQLGYELSDADIGKVFEEFKKLTAKKETIDTKELEAVIASTAMQVPSTYHLVNYVVNSGNIIPATANVTLEKDGEKFTGVSTGDGPIDAAFHAIEQIIGHHYDLDDFQVHAVTKGRGAVGSSIIRLRADGKLYPGNGVSTDIVGACIRAYINALNKIVYEGD